MKIVHIVPGFGGTFYCGNCLRDASTVRELKRAGHEATILPVYLPLTMRGDAQQTETPVFYGAVNIYLKQQVPFLRRMPHWLEGLFNSKPILNFAAQKAGSSRAQGNEELTESMLLGSEGYQHAELDELAEYLKNHEKPDVVHLSNALLLGMAGKIREIVGVPVVFSLQDEDMWIDPMSPAWQKRLWSLMAEKAADVDAFIPVSSWFASKMKEKLNLPDHKTTVIPIGINPGDYAYSGPRMDKPAIGYLSRLNEENGFGLLVDAFIRIRSNGKFPELKLCAAGGMTGDDKAFIRAQSEKLRRAGLLNDLIVFHDYQPGKLTDFFSSLTVMSVPVLKGEAFGMYQLESLASGIPLVQPALGAFPEIIEKTGGGIIYEPNTPGALAAAIEDLLDNPEKLIKIARAGRSAVEQHFNGRELARHMIDLYRGLIKK